MVEAEHTMLEQIFPRHVLQHMALHRLRLASRSTQGQLNPGSWNVAGEGEVVKATNAKSINWLQASARDYADLATSHPQVGLQSQTCSTPSSVLNTVTDCSHRRLIFSHVHQVVMISARMP